MSIRLAEKRDIPALMVLLGEILDWHHQLRPDLFKAQGQKYDEETLAQMLENENRLIYVYEKEGQVLGHLFCELQENDGSVLVPQKTLFIDDLCVLEAARGKKIGQQLYDFALALASQLGCTRLTLDVLEQNQAAKHFYEAKGMTVQKSRMELPIKE